MDVVASSSLWPLHPFVQVFVLLAATQINSHWSRLYSVSTLSILRPLSLAIAPAQHFKCPSGWWWGISIWHTNIESSWCVVHHPEDDHGNSLRLVYVACGSVSGFALSLGGIHAKRKVIVDRCSSTRKNRVQLKDQRIKGRLIKLIKVKWN